MPFYLGPQGVQSKELWPLGRAAAAPRIGSPLAALSGSICSGFVLVASRTSSLAFPTTTVCSLCCLLPFTSFWMSQHLFPKPKIQWGMLNMPPF